MKGLAGLVHLGLTLGGGDVLIDSYCHSLDERETIRAIFSYLRAKKDFTFSLDPLHNIRSKIKSFANLAGAAATGRKLGYERANEQPANTITSQSKLSQEQLTELQRSTHFDKKELQSWYKGTCSIRFFFHFA